MKHIKHEPINRTRTSLARSLQASAICVEAVLAGKSLPDSLAKLDPAVRPSAQAISFHTMRHLGFAKATKSLLLKKTPHKTYANALLLVSLALLEAAILSDKNDQEHGLTPGIPVYTVYTVVDQTVKAANGKLKPYKGLLNGTLRNYIRQRDTLLLTLQKNEEAVWNYPQWWIDTVKSHYPDCWQELLEAGNKQPPLILRVNQRKATVENVLALFDKSNIKAVPLNGQAVFLPNPAPVNALPGFTQGLWSVQDISAQKAAVLLQVHDGMHVLDACAAPGGKTSHLLEIANINLLSLDSDPQRLKLVVSNLQRLGLTENVKYLCADASNLSDWWDGVKFDAVLADVPCTASGVVRRNPDIRWLRRPEDIQKMAKLQRKIIDSLWQTVAKGGHLLFATCSIFPQEGELQAQAFCERHTDAVRQAAPGQILPLLQNNQVVVGDGFFYALFQKSI